MVQVSKPPRDLTTFEGRKWLESLHRYISTPTADYTVTNVVTTRTFDANNTSLNELADVVGSLIQDLISRGILE